MFVFVSYDFQSYALETLKSKSYLNHSPSTAMLSGTLTTSGD